MAKSKFLLPDWTGILLQEGPSGVVCIRKPGRKDEPRYWQFPGGKRHSNDRSSKVTAVREAHEETGIRLNVGDITLLGSTVEHNHHTHKPFELDFYQATITATQLKSRFTKSREGEEVRVFTWVELNSMSDFSPFHRMLAEKYGVWRKK